MAFEWNPPRINRRTLGAGYIIGVNLALLLVLVGYLRTSQESPLVLLVGALITLAILGLVTYFGYYMFVTDVTSEFVWSSAKGMALGLGIATLLSIIILAYATINPQIILPSLVVVLVVVGAVVGFLLGVILRFHRQNHDLRQINQYNSVLNRILRHDIRNAMNIIQGELDLLVTEHDLDVHDRAETITRTITRVVNLSDGARKIDTLNRPKSPQRYDIARVVRTAAASLTDTHQDARVHLDLPDHAWVAGGPLLESAVTNLLENAIIHHDTTPVIHATITTADPGTWRVTVADDGPGVPDQQLQILEDNAENELNHSNGLGLWLAKWTVESYDGTIDFARNQPRGTIVTITLPAAPDTTTRFRPRHASIPQHP